MKIDDDFCLCVLHSLFIISLRFNSQGAVGVAGKCNLVKRQSHSKEKQIKAQVISQSKSQSQQRSRR